MPNEATTFRELLEEDLESVFLNEEEYGEAVMFYPAHGGAARKLVAVIEQHQRPVSGEMVDHEQDEITVLVSRKLFRERGGVERPTVGDTLTRAGDPERYAYTGEVKESDPSSWWLVYVRQNPLGIGTNYRR